MNVEKTGALIASSRRKKNMTQRELAEMLHVTDRAVSKWERGLSFPDVSLLAPLADILGLTLTELLNGELSPQDFDSDERPLHEILALSKAALRDRTVKLRLHVLVLLVYGMILIIVRISLV
ncbi:MAG: helix-turn-helix domain-containing protein [Clostridia bacterium]|nr:helix-turn-helix domain-containing protein [Clostridia bacterium]